MIGKKTMIREVEGFQSVMSVHNFMYVRREPKDNTVSLVVTTTDVANDNEFEALGVALNDEQVRRLSDYLNELLK